AGESEAIDTEFANIQLAVSQMMVDNELSQLPVPVGDAPAINDMSQFPEVTETLETKGANAAFVTTAGVSEVLGYPLYGCQIVIDRNGDGVFDAEEAGPPIVLGDEIRVVNYVATQTTDSYYTVDKFGTITQWDDAAKTNQLNP
ncbi:unnamed protein product, partial [marine sediment metagenome]